MFHPVADGVRLEELRGVKGGVKTGGIQVHLL